MEQSEREQIVCALVNSLRLRAIECCILSPKFDNAYRQSLRTEGFRVEAEIAEAIAMLDPNYTYTPGYPANMYNQVKTGDDAS